jgi:hypothetical protein
MALRLFHASDESIELIYAQCHQFVTVERVLPLQSETADFPTRQMLAEMLEVAFWASLTTNEGRPTRVRMAMLRHGTRAGVQAFKRPIPYTEEAVGQLAPAVWSTGWLAVDVFQQPLCIWGISQHPIYDRIGAITIEVTDPGIIRVGIGALRSMVVFGGRSTAFLRDAQDMTLTTRLRSILGKDVSGKSMAETSTAWRECLALGLLARMVLEDRHGGMLLVVPHETDAWKSSLKPFAHEYVEPDSAIRDSIRAAERHEISRANVFTKLNQSDASDSIKDAMLAAFSQINWDPEDILRPVARLAAVDGAVVLSDEIDILGFGAMISVSSVPDLYLIQPGQRDAVKIRVEDAGGTRHQSAVRFVGHHHGSFALVISHEGHLSLAHWSTERHGVVLQKNAEWWI